MLMGCKYHDSVRHLNGNASSVSSMHEPWPNFKIVCNLAASMNY